MHGPLVSRLLFGVQRNPFLPGELLPQFEAQIKHAFLAPLPVPVQLIQRSLDFGTIGRVVTI
jgi:hypothetical protein